MIVTPRSLLFITAVGLLLAWPLSAHAAKAGKKGAGADASLGKVSKIISGASGRGRQWHALDEQASHSVRHLGAQEQREEDGPPPPPPNLHGRHTTPPPTL